MALHKKHLKRIAIRGYKSIKDCDVSFGSINVLIGSNGAGKSNFISAFSFLRNILAKELRLTVARRGLNALLYLGAKTTDRIAFEAEFDGGSYGFTLIPTDDHRLIFESEHLGGTSLGSGHSESCCPTADAETPDWCVYHFHDTGRSARVKQEHNLSDCLHLAWDAGNLAAFLYRLRQHFGRSYAEIVRVIQMIAPYFGDFVLEPQEANPEQIVLKWRQKGCDSIFNASQLSDGTLRFICLTVLLLQPPELRPSAILIDEPELGLHPYAITLFAELVRRAAADTQIILSTQSVELLNEFEAADIIVVDRSDSGSQFRRPDEAALELWLDEDYALGDLWKKNLLGGRLSK